MAHETHITFNTPVGRFQSVMARGIVCLFSRLRCALGCIVSRGKLAASVPHLWLQDAATRSYGRPQTPACAHAPIIGRPLTPNRARKEKGFF